MKEIGIACGIIAVFILAALALIDLYGSYQCSAYHKITGKAVKWQTLDICYIETPDGWQRWDEYTKRAIASEGLRK